MTEAEKKPVPAVGVSFSVPIGRGDQSIGMTFQTHFPGDMSPGLMDALLDMYVGRATRQQKIGKIPELKVSIRQHEQSISNIEEDISRLDKQNAEKWAAHNRKGPAELPTADKANRENGLVNRDRFKEMLAKLKEELAESEALLNLELPKAKAAKAA